MGLLNSLRNLKNWIADKTGINGLKKDNKRKHEDCENINSKRARMDDSLVEVVEISDESLSEVEEVEITEPGPSTMPLRASPPVRLINDGHYQRRTTSPARPVNLTESKDKMSRSYSFPSQPFKSHQTIPMVRSVSGSSIEEKYTKTSSFEEFKNTYSDMEGGFSALNISNSIPSNDSKAEVLVKVVKNYVLPKPENTELSDSDSRSPLSLRKEHLFNLSNLSQTSGKENLEFPELGVQKNRIIKQEMFYDRVLKRFKEKQAESQVLAITNKKPLEDIFKEKLDNMAHELQKCQPPKKKEIFPGESQEIFNFIKCEMSRPVTELIVQGKTIRIKDLKTLYQRNGWLNDEVINHYLHMIVARDSDSLHSFDTFFYSKLSQNGYQSVRRWSKKKDIFACKKMLTPIHMGNHWCLVCVNFVEKTIKYYDSLKGKNSRCLNDIFNYLKEEYKNKKNKDFDSSGWQLMDADDCPIQHNSYDCGVFLCANAEFLARDAVLDFVQDDLPLLRLKICYEILKNKFLY